MAGAVQKTHGMSETRIYNIWLGMRNRCNNPNNSKYKNYGGRGIKVCDRWVNSFENFYEDMSKDYKEDLTIDRINVNDNYSPENCRWLNNVEQQYNKTYTKWITINGETTCLQEAIKKYGVTWKIVTRKLNHGFTPEEVFIEKKFLPSEQQHWFELEGELIRLKEACEKYGVVYKKAQRRLAKGFTPHQIFITKEAT